MIDKSKIPDGAEFINYRRKLIISELSKYKNTTVKCPCLSNADVVISMRGIRETANHASKSRESTIAALELKKAIRGAILINVGKPKENNTQRYKFQFVVMYELKYAPKNYKIMIGGRKIGTLMQYCITAQ